MGKDDVATKSGRSEFSHYLIENNLVAKATIINILFIDGAECNL